jgi:BirA family biotin operon repressor/biotin-[acetyl-CoA-carboxylase] ligase
MTEADSLAGYTAETVSNRLRTKQLGRTLLCLKECTSTNDVGRKLANKGAPHGFLIVSETQSAGRGRHGRKWISPRGGIWMTIILRPPLVTSTLEALPLIGALSVTRGIQNALGINAKVRWPNDVVVDGSKVAGVIAESQQEGNSVEFALLGIGVNANFRSYRIRDENIQAVTLMDIRGAAIDGSKLVCEILLALEELLALVVSDRLQLLELLRRNDCSAGRKVKVVMEKKTIEGVFVDYESVEVIRVVTNEELVAVNVASAVFVEYSKS